MIIDKKHVATHYAENRSSCITCSRRRDLETCEAFPKGIPTVIRDGKVKHDHPYPGDDGVLYKSKVPALK